MLDAVTCYKSNINQSQLTDYATKFLFLPLLITTVPTAQPASIFNMTQYVQHTLCALKVISKD